MKTVLTTLILLAILALTAGVCYGDVGARPMAMGGAFIALADDANATYYNPAGLAQMPAGTTLGTWTNTADDRDIVGFQQYASLVSSFATSKLAKTLAFGASYIANDTDLTLGLTHVENDQQSYWGSIGVDTGSLGMFGINVRKVHDSVSGHSVDSKWAIDASYLYKVAPELTVGVLAQDVNEPSIRVDNLNSMKRTVNWRAGLAYKPMSGMVVTIDGFDLTNDAEQQSARVGVEKILKSFTVRAGYFGLGSDVQQGATFGIGICKELYNIDATVLMGDFDNAVLLSAGFKMM